MSIHGAPHVHAKSGPRRQIMVAAFAAVWLLASSAAAQEPPMLAGTWVGTWFMGKYEQPIEFELTQRSTDLVGRVTLWGYPGSTGPASMVRTPVTGTVEADRVRLSWAMPERGQFSAELTLASAGTLRGLGGIGQITTGFELSRSR